MESRHPFCENAGNCFTAKEKEAPRVQLLQKQGAAHMLEILISVRI